MRTSGEETEAQTTQANCQPSAPADDTAGWGAASRPSA